jgi:hypothetical protein
MGSTSRQALLLDWHRLASYPWHRLQSINGLSILTLQLHTRKSGLGQHPLRETLERLAPYLIQNGCRGRGILESFFQLIA